MGVIYKITNTVNDKVYIGATTRKLKVRWAAHKKDSRYGTCPIYKAIQKLGIENFNITEIEKVENTDLYEREHYWIKYYDSYNNGYNCNYGGVGEIYLDSDRVLSLYKETKSISEVHRLTGHARSAIRKFLKKKGIKEPKEYYSNQQKRPLIAINQKTGLIIEFESVSEAVRFLKKKFNLKTGCGGNIVKVCKGERNHCYGYNFKYLGGIE